MYRKRMKDLYDGGIEVLSFDGSVFVGIDCSDFNSADVKLDAAKVKKLRKALRKACRDACRDVKGHR